MNKQSIPIIIVPKNDLVNVLKEIGYISPVYNLSSEEEEPDEEVYDEEDEKKCIKVSIKCDTELTNNLEKLLEDK